MARPTEQDKADFIDVMTTLNPTLGQYVRECIAKHGGDDLRSFAAAFETAAATARGWCIGRFG